MKKQFFFLIITAALIMGCTSSSRPPYVEEDWMSGTVTSSQGNETSRANDIALSPSSIVGHEWKLIEVYIDGNDTRFSRNTLPAEPGNFFTLNLDGKNISGVGVPNRYSAPYTQGDNQSITIMLIAATRMASFFQPENLSEDDFFIYLQNAYSCKLVDNNMELLSKTQAGSEVRLVFSL